MTWPVGILEPTLTTGWFSFMIETLLCLVSTLYRLLCFLYFLFLLCWLNYSWWISTLYSSNVSTLYSHFLLTCPLSFLHHPFRIFSARLKVEVEVISTIKDVEGVLSIYAHFRWRWVDEDKNQNIISEWIFYNTCPIQKCI